jgi:acyl-coenzyme A thioesterase PaaI-like protein
MTDADTMEDADMMDDADTMDDADATTAGPPGPLAAAGVLTAATRRLMRAAATTGLPPERVLELADDIQGLADTLETLPRDRPHRIPFDAEREAEIRAGEPWRMFHFNPLGIPLAITVRDGVARAELTPDALFEGPPDWLHGGFAAAIMDVLLGTVVMVEAEPAFTARLDVHFRRGTVLDRPVVCEGRLVSTDGRKINAHGWITQDGHRTVEAQGLFVPMRRPA